MAEADAGGVHKNSRGRPAASALPWRQSRHLRIGLVLGLGALTLAAGLGGFQPLSHDDLFFHLRTGAMALDQHHIPTTDSFSFTQVGTRWVSHEWGFGVVVELVYRAGGPWALVGFASLLTAVLFLVLARATLTRLSGRSQLLALPLLAAAVWIIAPEAILRAALISTVFLGLTVELLERFRRRPSFAPGMALAALMLVWANLHTAVAFGLFAVGLWSLEGLTRSLRARSATGARWWAALGIGCPLIALLNPNGLTTLLFPVTVALLLHELREVTDAAHYAPPEFATDPGVFLLALLLALLLAAAALGARSTLRTIPLARWALVGTFLYLGLTGRRFAPELVVVIVPVTARLLAAAVANRRPRSRTLLALALASTVGVLLALAVRLDLRELRSPFARNLPVQAAEFFEHHQLDTHHFLNHQNFGGYLGWRLGAPVFWDGRTDVFGRMFVEVSRSSLATLQHRWDLESLIIAEHDWATIGPQLTPEDWSVVFWDDFSAIAVRRNGPYAELADQFELRLTPAFGGIPVSQAATDPAVAAALEAELRRVLVQAPQSQRALYFLGRLVGLDGRAAEALALLERANQIGSNPIVEQALAEAQISP